MNGYNMLPYVNQDVIKKANTDIKYCEAKAASYGMKALEQYCEGFIIRSKERVCINKSAFKGYIDCVVSCANDSLEEVIKKYKKV